MSIGIIDGRDEYIQCLERQKLALEHHLETLREASLTIDSAMYDEDKRVPLSKAVSLSEALRSSVISATVLARHRVQDIDTELVRVRTVPNGMPYLVIPE